MRNLILIVAALPIAGCGDFAARPAGPSSPATAKASAVKPATLPDPTEVDFKDWPKATEKPYRIPKALATQCRAPMPNELPAYHGPHAVAYVVVRVNPEAMEDFKARRPLAVGSVIVKEKHSDAKGGEPQGYTAMVKREKGYDPDHGDWEYADVRLKPEKKAARGKIESCIACHDGKKESDYLFRDYLPK